MANILGVLLNLGLLSLIFGLVLGLCLKFFARSLRLIQALQIGWVSSLVGAVVPVAYFLAKPQLQLPEAIDGLLGLVTLCVMGVVATRLARSYGVQKAGYIGVGAKSVVALTVVFWIPILIMMLTGTIRL